MQSNSSNFSSVRVTSPLHHIRAWLFKPMIFYCSDLSRDERPALSVSGLVTGVSEPYLDIDT